MKKIPAATAIAMLLLTSLFSAAQSMRSLMLMYPGSSTEGTSWANIRTDSIAWLLRSTYEIDPHAKGNQVFRNASLIGLMSEDIRKGRVRAFGTQTDSFTTVLSYDEVLAITDKVIADGGNSCRIRIIEDLIGMKDTGQSHHRIIGIAPEMKHAGIWEPLFWIYFQELKPSLARTAVSKKDADTWLTVFDRRDYHPRLISSADTINYAH